MMLRTQSPNPTWRAFTLIELLIVVAIIAILAAIAVPNFLEAQVRSKISRVKADQRTVATALESYVVDQNHFPPQYFNGTKTLVAQSQYTLFRLTTPVSYISSIEAVRDPFADGLIKNGPGIPGAGVVYAQSHMFYQCFETFLADYSITAPYANLKAWGLSSFGPDKADDAVIWRMYNYACVGGPGYEQQLTLGTYDPTNGTISVGDIARFGGAVPSAASRVTN